MSSHPATYMPSQTKRKVLEMPQRELHAEPRIARCIAALHADILRPELMTHGQTGERIAMYRKWITYLAASLIALTLVTPAHAQATRTWVSGVGDDVNPCSRTAPCKTFAGTISKTAAGGEISVLDPGGFGAVTIVKSITISGDGTLAGILNAGGVNGVIVNTPNATDIVVLRNLSINGGGTGLNGIRYIGGGQLVVENVTVTGQTQAGIDVSHSGTGNLLVRDSSFTGGLMGIRIGTGTIHASLNNVSIRETTSAGINNLVGAVDLSNSVVAQNSGVGVLAKGGSINLENCQLTKNGVGAQAQVGATIRLSNVGLYDNDTTLGCGGGTLATASNNRKGGNGAGAACPTNGTVTSF
jgi:hypothetical protein